MIWVGGVPPFQHRVGVLFDGRECENKLGEENFLKISD